MGNLQILFGFSGRIRRLQWWLGSLIIVGIVLVFVVITMTLVGVLYGDYRNMPATMSAAFGSMLIACYIAMIWIQLALGVKRLHDRDSTGWWMLLGIVPFGGFVLLVMLGFLDGTQGHNKYGPSPKGIGGSADERDLSRLFS